MIKKNDKSFLERLLFKKFELWILLLVILLGTMWTFGFGFSVYYKMSGGTRAKEVTRIAMQIATLPEKAMRLAEEKEAAIQPQLTNLAEFDELDIVDGDFKDDGYLLVSGYRPENKITTAYLYDISKRKIIHQWIPPIEKIHENSTARGNVNERDRYRTQHPLIIDDGSVIFTSGEGPLVRIDKCSNFEWVVDRHFHHSIEVNHQGDVIVPHIIPYSKDGLDTDGIWKKFSRIRDDGFATVSNDGKIIKEWSITKILEDNEYFGLLYGVGFLEGDRIHLNDAEPILEDDEFVKKGDVALSSRHLSTVFLYRPSTNKIIWLKTGPWLTQHDVNYIGNGKFTVFGNDAVRLNAKKQSSAYGSSSVYQYDMSTDKVTRAINLGIHNIYNGSEGRSKLLSNGDFFVESTNSGIIYRLTSEGKIRWRYVNSVGNGKKGALHWSRYLSRDEVNLDWLSNTNCS